METTIRLLLDVDTEVVKTKNAPLDVVVNEAVAELMEKASLVLRLDVTTSTLDETAFTTLRIPVSALVPHVKEAIAKMLEVAEYERDRKKYDEACEAQKKMEAYMREKYPRNFLERQKVSSPAKSPPRDASPVRPNTRPVDVWQSLWPAFENFYDFDMWKHKLVVYEEAWKRHPFFTKMFDLALALWKRGHPDHYNEKTLMDWITRQHETHFWHHCTKITGFPLDVCDACQKVMPLTHKLRLDTEADYTVGYCSKCGPGFQMVYQFLTHVHWMIKNARDDPWDQTLSKSVWTRFMTIIGRMTKFLE